MNKRQKKKRENDPVYNAIVMLLRIGMIESHKKITPELEELKEQQLEKLWEEFKSINNIELP